MQLKELIYHVKGTCIDIHRNVGPGLLESVYHAILLRELLKRGYEVMNEVSIPVIYEGIKYDHGFRADLVVESKLIIELKSVEALAPVHFKQMITYVQLSSYQAGLLVNFNTDKIYESGLFTWFKRCATP